MFLADELQRIQSKYYDPKDPSSIMLYRDPETECILNLGIVEDNQDPDKLGRLRVRIVTLDHSTISPWIPLIRPFATANAGLFILPDIGEQVLIVHPGNSPSHPVVLGSMFTPRNGIDPGDNKGNSKTFYLSKSGSTIRFDDTEGEETLTLCTKDGDMRLSLSPKGIQVVNQVGDITIRCKKLTVDSGNLSMKSSKESTFESTDSLTIKSSKNIKLAADKDMTLDGSAIKLKGNMGVTAGSKQIAKADDMVVGLDMHTIMVPSNSGQTPVPGVPHPFIGKLKDKLADDVEIGGKKVAVKGSKATFSSPGHIPTPPGTGFQKKPKNEAEVSGGCCDKVTAGGKPVAVLGSTATSCNDMGMKDQSKVVAVGATVVLPIKLPCIDELTFKMDGGFMINTRDLIAPTKTPGQEKQPKLTSPQWSSSSAKVGEEVTLTVSCSDLYSGATVYFTIWEEGANRETDKPLAKLNAPNKGGKAEATWKWFYRSEDWPEPFTEKPKFVFTAIAFKCEEVESGAVEMGVDIKIKVLLNEEVPSSGLKYRLVLTDDSEKTGELSATGLIEETDLIPGTVKLFFDSEEHA